MKVCRFAKLETARCKAHRFLMACTQAKPVAQGKKAPASAKHWLLHYAKVRDERHTVTITKGQAGYETRRARARNRCEIVVCMVLSFKHQEPLDRWHLATPCAFAPNSPALLCWLEEVEKICDSSCTRKCRDLYV